MKLHLGPIGELRGFALRGKAGTASTAQASESSATSSPASHSQIVNTCQPWLVNRSVTATSLARFDANLACQNSGRVAGVVANRHPLC